MNAEPVDLKLPREDMPTRGQALLFALKAWRLRLRRLWRDAIGIPPRRLPRARISPDGRVLVKSRTALFTSMRSEEFALQMGKVQNLRVAARRLDGAVLREGEVFGFWAHIGRPTRSHGFADGRELREGCVIPSVGGGLCQLSNALYDVALRAGCEIVERHAHSRRLPGSMAVAGRDATVFWNYIDLRFRAPSALQLVVRVEERDLVVRLHAVNAAAVAPRVVTIPESNGDVQPEAAESCESCGVTNCFRNPSATALASEGFTAWLVDAFVPEFEAWIGKHRHARDWLFTPLDSRRFRVGAYHWNTAGFAAIREARAAVLRRSWISRRLAAQGAERQRALLALDATLAEAFARRLPPFATHLVVSQNLLPHLWARGELGGRTFDVLMTRLPLAELERVLDRAAAQHPGSTTLADFRAPREVVAMETAALAAAHHWITPHSAIAQLAGARAVSLDWQLPSVGRAGRGKWIVFPASTLGRKGAWELRSVARELDLPVRLCGPVLEGVDFWSGVRTERADDSWLAGACAVVLPAWVEHQPRRLLQAVAAGVPVIASDACGLAGVAGVTTVGTGDVEGLRMALAEEAALSVV